MSKYGPIQEPDLAALLDMTRQRIFADLNCHQVGIITNFNPSTCTASVQIAARRVVGDQIVSYPPLIDCPVMMLCGSTGGLTIPVMAGDTCLVLFNDRNIDNWYSTGNVAQPNTARMHDLSDGIVFVGIRSLANPIPDYSATAVELRNIAEGAKVSLDSLVGIENNATSLHELLNKILDTIQTWTTTSGLTANAATLAKVVVNRTQVDSLLKP